MAGAADGGRLTEDAACPVLAGGVRCVQVPKDVMASLSPHESPSGRPCSPFRPLTWTAPEQLTGDRYLVLDGVHGPRQRAPSGGTADAFETDGLLLTNACADPFSWKTIRATMARAFRCLCGR